MSRILILMCNKREGIKLLELISGPVMVSTQIFSVHVSLQKVNSLATLKYIPVANQSKDKKYNKRNRMSKKYAMRAQLWLDYQVPPRVRSLPMTTTTWQSVPDRSKRGFRGSGGPLFRQIYLSLIALPKSKRCVLYSWSAMFWSSYIS